MQSAHKRRRLALGRAAVFAVAITLLGLSLAGARSAKNSPTNSSGVLSPDKGKLKILLDGQPIGTEEFEIAVTGTKWTARGTTELKVSQGASARVSGTLVLQPNGAPVSYEWTSQNDKKNGASIRFENGVAKMTLQLQGAKQPFEQDLTFGSPLISVLDNNLYHHYAILARLYDWSKRGAQSFPVLIPQELTPGTISVEASGTQGANGKSYEGLRVSTSDLEVLLSVDKDHRLMRLEVPLAKVSVVRE